MDYPQAQSNPPMPGMPDTGGGQQAQRVADPNRWKPGKYKAKAIDWTLGKTQAGLPQVKVLFEYDQPADQPGTFEKRNMTWFGSFTEKSEERTFDTLIGLGLESADVTTLESGRPGAALDSEREVEIVVEHETYNGIKRAKLAWVNIKAGLQSKLDPGEGKALFMGVSQKFKAHLASKGMSPNATPRAVTGAIQQTRHATPQNSMPGGPEFTEEDVPF